MTRIANEAKVCRLTKSLILGQGQGKVISFANIEEARVARATKDDKKGKGKCNQKRKSATLKVNKLEAAKAKVELELKLKVARATKEVIKGNKRGQKRKIAT